MRQEHNDSLEAKLTEILKLRSQLKHVEEENIGLKMRIANPNQFG
jgi:hypothetical protein